MGYVMVTSACFGCRRIFSYNPKHVPSIPIKGVREPICRDCVEFVNPKRVANGLEPIVIRPQAYEPLREEEL